MREEEAASLLKSKNMGNAGQKCVEIAYIDAFSCKKEEKKRKFLAKCVDNPKMPCYNNV